MNNRLGELRTPFVNRSNSTLHGGILVRGWENCVERLRVNDAAHNALL